MKTPTSDAPTSSDSNGSAIYGAVATRSALASVAVVGLLYGLRFTHTLPPHRVAIVSFGACLAVLALGWVALNGFPGSSRDRQAYSGRTMGRAALHFAGVLLYLYVSVGGRMPMAELVFFSGSIVLLGLWWAGMIGTFGALLSREMHPFRSLLLAGFYIAVASLVLWWVFWHTTPDNPLFRVTDLK